MSKVWLGGGVVVALGAAVVFWPSPAPTPPVGEALPAAAPERSPAPKPQQGAAPTVMPVTPAPATADTTGFVAYPDGTRLPPLNGVKVAPSMVFHRMAPFSPVVGKETDRQGLEWYVHQNGMRTTTRVQTDGTAVSEMSMGAPVAPALDR